MSEQTVSFVKSMVSLHPELGAILEEHIKDNLGEILPHVFFGDVARYTSSLFPAAPRGGLLLRRELRDLLDYLEATYSSGDEELRELISVSFLENLPRPGELGAQIREMLGPNLSRQLRVIG